jgi:hypothetical protein
VLYYSTRRRAWRFAASIEAKGDFARASAIPIDTENTTAAPWQVGKTWQVFDGKTWEHDADLEVVYLRNQSTSSSSMAPTRRGGG